MIDIGYTAGAGSGSVQGPAVNGRERAEGSFSDTMAKKFRLAAKDMSLVEYKLYFHDRVKALYTHPSQRHVDWLIDITDEAYLRMQADPAYEQQVLEYLARNKGADVYGHAPRFVYIRIEDTWEKCHGYAFGLQEDSRARRAAERRRLAAEQARKERRKKLLKDYLQKRAQAKRLQDKLLQAQISKRWLEHVRLTREWKKEEQTKQTQKERSAEQKSTREQAVREWNEEWQAVQAANAYEANLLLMNRYQEQLFS